MPDDDRDTFPVAVSGLLRGTDLAGTGLLALRGDVIELALERRKVAVPLATVDGIALHHRGIDLYVETGDVIRVDGARDHAQMKIAVARRVFALPEVTRALRTLGSRRAHPEDAAHDRFFGPFLAARRRVEVLADPVERIRAFEASALRAAVDRLLAELPAERYRARAPDRRALEAELRDCSAPLLTGLDDLAHAERGVHEAEEAVRVAAWRAWTEALRLVFTSADACWLGLHGTLERDRRSPAAHAPARWWRRWIGGGGKGHA
ncbi:MAG: hypothetical protein M3373_03380 [Gemmatimonadota bacterium]|nr:hypothetical protein [Gemmatimonadota bacterium]